MIVLALILLFIFLLIGWILFVPLVVDLDTSRSLFQIYQPVTFRFWITQDFSPSLRIFGITISLRGSTTKHKQQAKQKKTKKTVSASQWRLQVKKILSSITIKRFIIDVDTGDVVTNAKLVPIFLMLSRDRFHWATNFEGRVYVNWLAEVRLYQIGWAFLLFNFKHKNYGHEF
jgi:hypothetical protein